jgi:drug/metabolite transporter (DMT)-like permease
VIFAGLIDWWIWKDVPELISIIGMIVVCVGGLLTINFKKIKKVN